ncbi:MAG TPA: glycosyltransferase family 39 protein, partial [Prolixibacteraceae bacterium]|nr:glycosyltransferase family 39 protein [Prolixibacteraceae bacterium]
LMICTFTIHNGVLPPNIMEARNLVTAREMVTENNWLQPTMNGELRLEKPPLPTWITACSMILSGQDNHSLLRLPSALAAMLLIFFLFRLTKELTEDPLLPWLAAGTASTSFYLFFLARDISWDMFCHSFMLGAIWLLYKGLKNKELRYAPFAGSAVLMGLSFLSKGPVAFYALLLPWILAICLTGKHHNLNFHPKGIALVTLLALALSSIWPVYIFTAFPDYASAIAIQESTAWINREVKPFYHYWSFTAQSGIWVLPATFSLFIPFLGKRPAVKENYLPVVLWTLLSVVLLSIMPEKKERYLFPVLIPLSIATAFYFRAITDIFSEGKEGKWDRILLLVNGILMILIAFLIPFAFIYMVRQSGHAPEFIPVFFAFAGFWSIGIFMVRALKQKTALHIWLGMVLLVASTTVLLLGNTPEIITKNQQYRPYAELRKNPKVAGLPFFFSEKRDNKLIEVIWACGRKIQYPKDPEKKELPGADAFVLLSPKEPAEIFPHELLSGYNIETIGLFDANLHEKWGGKILRNWVTVFRKKE